LKYFRGCGQGSKGFTIVERGVTRAAFDYNRSPVAGGVAIIGMIAE